MLAKGAVLDHYQIVEPVGSGGMGEVYAARDQHLDRIMAVKVLPESLGWLDRYFALVRPP